MSVPFTGFVRKNHFTKFLLQRPRGERDASDVAQTHGAGRIRILRRRGRARRAPRGSLAGAGRSVATRGRGELHAGRDRGAGPAVDRRRDEPREPVPVVHRLVPVLVNDA